MQAILVRLYPATNHRAAYYIASSLSGRLRIAKSVADLSLNPQRYVAEGFVLSKLAHAPKVPLLQGTLSNGDAVFVFDHPLSRD